MARNYDPILTRLIMILGKLIHNELPNMKELSEEFNVSLRTIQNDIYKRLSLSFPIIKDCNGRLKFEDGYSFLEYSKKRNK